MIINIPLGQIDDNPWQTRQNYDPNYIAELAADIKRNGLIQMPSARIVMRNGRYPDGLVLNGEQVAKFEVNTHLVNDDAMRVQLAVGHNRVRAYRLLATEDDAYGAIPTQIAAYGDEQMAKMAWSENAQRRDLTPIEEVA